MRKENFEDRVVRDGRIFKELAINADEFWANAARAIVGVTVDFEEMAIQITPIQGTAPNVERLFYALLADKDVRRLIRNYQEKGRKQLYKVWETSGVSGRRDIFITTGRPVGVFRTSRTKHLVHISGFGKLNEGFGNKNGQMYIGDFVEVCVYLGLTEDMRVKHLKELSGAKYVKPKFADELYEGFSRIL